MGYRKRKSEDYDKAFTRLSAIKSIHLNLNLGNGLTVGAYESCIKKVHKSIDEYNTLLSKADDKLNELEMHEAELRDLSERMLLAVGSKYGKDSSQYEQAGGVKKSDRKKPAAKKSPGNGPAAA